MAPTPMKMSSGNSSVLMPAPVENPEHALLARDAGQGQVGEDDPETDREQQHRLVILGDAQVYQDPANDHHHHHLPGEAVGAARRMVRLLRLHGTVLLPFARGGHRKPCG